MTGYLLMQKMPKPMNLKDLIYFNKMLLHTGWRPARRSPIHQSSFLSARIAGLQCICAQVFRYARWLRPSFFYPTS